MQMHLQSIFILSRVVTCPMVLIKGSLLNLFVFPVLLANVYYSQILTVFSTKLQLESQTAAENVDECVKCCKQIKGEGGSSAGVLTQSMVKDQGMGYAFLHSAVQSQSGQSPFKK